MISLPRETWPGGPPISVGLLVMAGFALSALSVHIIYRLWFHPLAKFPGPPLLALTSLPVQWKNNITGTWVREVAMLHRKYGHVVRIGPNHLAFEGNIGWPQIYARRPGKPEFQKDPKFFFQGKTFSIIESPYDVHRRQRRQLNHAFSDAALNEQEAIITQYIDLLIRRLTENAEAGKSVNIVNWVNFTTFDIIGDLTFTDTFGSLRDSDYHPWVLNFFKAIRGDCITRFNRFYPMLKPIVSLLESKDLHVADEHRMLAYNKAQSRIALGEQPDASRRDFMTYMLKKNRDGNIGMTEDEAVMNSPLLIAAGSETTATALSGFFFYLGQNPTIYSILTKEIRSAFSQESDITMNSTGQLQYLHACLEETLRIYPPAAETPSRVSPGAEIDDKFVPAGTVVSVYQWATFHNPKNFADPDSFRPQRWLPTTHPLYDSKYDDDDRSVFKPFSHGSRDCIGKNLAYSEMRVVAARILYRFDFELLPGQEDWHDSQKVFIVWEKGPLNIKLTPRIVV